jgi:hypothetical protein
MKLTHSLRPKDFRLNNPHTTREESILPPHLRTPLPKRLRSTFSLERSPRAVYNSETCAGVAQLVEQRIRNAKVVGSTPISGTRINPQLLTKEAQPYLLCLLLAGLSISITQSEHMTLCC